MKKLLIIFAFLSLFWLISPRVNAASVSWDGGAATANWTDAANWNPDGVPTDADDVTINQNVTVNIAASTTINSLIIGQSGGG